jgi:hypothetical protein
MKDITLYRDLTKNTGVLSENKKVHANKTYKEDRDDYF